MAFVVLLRVSPGRRCHWAPDPGCNYPKRFVPLAPGHPLHGITFFASPLMPRGHFLSWVTKNRAAYREQRPLAGYAKAARGRPKVKVNKEVTGNRFRLVESRSFCPAFSRQNTAFPGLLCLPAIKEDTGFKSDAFGSAFACFLLLAIRPEPEELDRVISARLVCRAAPGLRCGRLRPAVPCGTQIVSK